jgi:hypothetical protein
MTDASTPEAKPAKNPIQQLEALGLAVIDGGTAKEDFSYPGGYTGTFKNELGIEMTVTLNGDIKIDVKPAA